MQIDTVQIDTVQIDTVQIDTVQARGGFGMYPFESVRPAWDGVWAAVASRCEWVGPDLEHVDDVHASWTDPAIGIQHVCGWPYAAWYDDSMLLVGAFDVDLPAEAEVGPGLYRSVLMSPHQLTLDDLVEQRARAVVNSVDSLSGSLSLIAATVPVTGKWPGLLTETGSHLESLRALKAGRADLACIDAWTLALVTAEQPALVSGLHRLGYGPVIPTPAITLRTEWGQHKAHELGRAFADALADPATDAARQALFVRGFTFHDPQVYRDTLPLG